MTYSPVPSVATGDLWTAANQNQYIRDNFAALWPYQAVGDIAIATASNTIGNLAKGNELNVLSVVGGNVGYYPLSSLLNLSASQVFSADTINTAYVDVPGSTYNITLARHATLWVMLAGQVTAAGAETLYYRVMMDGVYQNEAVEAFSANLERTTISINRFSAVAGTRTLKAQFRSMSGVRVNLYNAQIFALAIPG